MHLQNKLWILWAKIFFNLSEADLRLHCTLVRLKYPVYLNWELFYIDQLEASRQLVTSRMGQVQSPKAAEILYQER